MGTLILGGTFNPVHAGHVRFGEVARQAVRCSRLLWLPSLAPVHRRAEHLLPFALRVELLLAACDAIESATVCDIEGRLGGGFTIDVLPRLFAEERIDAPCFAMGLDQFRRLPSWYRGGEIPLVTDLIVWARGGLDAAVFHRTVAANWLEFDPDASPPGCVATYRARHHQRCISLLEAPPMEVSGSMVRQRWCAGESIAHLVPSQVEERLQRHRQEIDRIWRREADR